MAGLLKAGAGALSAALSSPTSTSGTSITSCPHHPHAPPRRPHHRPRLGTLVALPPLPVAGIDAAEAGGALHAVRRALAVREGGPLSCDLWLAALCCAQEASDRLLADLDDARSAAAFWRGRLRAGGHGAFMLLGRGPAQFAAGVVGGLSTSLRAAQGMRQQREQRREDGRPASDSGGGGDGGTKAPAAAAAAADQQQQQPSSATDRIQERIDALEALSRRLAAALAGVHRAADLLRLELPPGTAAADAAAAAAAAAPSAEAAMAPSAPLASADPAAAERAIAACLRRLQEALRDVPLAAAEAARRGDRGDDDGGEEGAAATTAGPPPPPPRSNATPTTTPATTTTPTEDLAAIVAVLEGSSSSCCCPLCPPAAAAAEEEATSLLLFSRVLPSSRDAADALRRAARAALSRGALAPAPAWASMPSRLQRHWLRYSVMGACALAAGGWAYRHSRLGGSDDLERWAGGASSSLSSAWRAHVVDPLAAVRRELFATLRDRPAIVSPVEFNQDREALMRMLSAFEDDHGGEGETGEAAAATAAAAAAAPLLPPPPPTDPSSPSSPSPSPSSSSSDHQHQLMSRGMARVMSSYERELRHPLRNLLAGSLARAVLIQVQRLKLDTEAAMLELDQILRANELSLTLVAAVPSIAIALLLARGAWRLALAALLGAPPDAKREAVGCRVAMGQLERALGAARAAAAAAAAGGAGAAFSAAAAASPSSSPRLLKGRAAAADKGGAAGAGADADASSAAAAAAQVVAVAEGAALHALHAVFQEASRLYRLRALAGGGGGGAEGGWWGAGGDGGGGLSSSSSSSPSAWRRSGEWPYLREGLVQLARPPLSSQGKLEYHRHLTRTYSLFQP